MIRPSSKGRTPTLAIALRDNDGPITTARARRGVAVHVEPSSKVAEPKLAGSRKKRRPWGREPAGDRLDVYLDARQEELSMGSNRSHACWPRMWVVQLEALLGIGRRTSVRWRRWWTEAFRTSRFWQDLRCRFAPS
jgi:hypothetical protein